MVVGASFSPLPHNFVSIFKADQAAQHVHGKVLRDIGEQERCDPREEIAFLESPSSLCLYTYAQAYGESSLSET